MIRLFISILFLALLHAEARAQTATCEAVLIKETITLRDNTHTRLAIIRSISEDTYEQSKANGTLDVVIPYLNIPIGATYSQFDEARRNFLSKYSYELDRQQALEILISRLPDNVVQGYIKCLQVETDAIGVRYAFAAVDNKSATLVIRFNGPRGQKVRLDSADIVGGKFRQQVKRSWGPGIDQQSIIVTRNSPLEALKAVVNIGGYPGAPAHVPLEPPLKQTVYVWTHVGNGDIGFHDLSCSSGREPHAATCDQTRAGKITAVCFPDRMNPAAFPGCNPQDWCTYKDLPPEKFQGGLFKGAFKWSCTPKQVELPQWSVADRERFHQFRVRNR